MVIKITNKCNFHCAHCGMNSTARGKHMPRAIWKAAIKLAAGYSDSVILSGGEPTLHPDFKTIVFDCLGMFCDVWLATNGSQTKTTLILSIMAERGLLGVALSLDPFHDPIEQSVIDAFKHCGKLVGFDNRSSYRDLREVRDTSARLIKAGRCKDGEETCLCPDVMVFENGDIRGCACNDAPSFGTVLDPEIPDNWQHNTCSHEQNSWI